MKKFIFSFILYEAFLWTTGTKCEILCSTTDTQMVCAFDIHGKSYTMFPSVCAMHGNAQCKKRDYVKTPYEYCIKDHFRNTRRVYGDSCPVFCPSHYRPVCAYSKHKDYSYRTFTNGCHLDMLNCRGGDDDEAYVEVPLRFCQGHPMKNIFKEKIIVSDLYDYWKFARRNL